MKNEIKVTILIETSQAIVKEWISAEFFDRDEYQNLNEHLKNREFGMFSEMQDILRLVLETADLKDELPNLRNIKESQDA